MARLGCNEDLVRAYCGGPDIETNYMYSRVHGAQSTCPPNCYVYVHKLYKIFIVVVVLIRGIRRMASRKINQFKKSFSSSPVSQRPRDHSRPRQYSGLLNPEIASEFGAVRASVFLLASVQVRVPVL